MQLTTFIRYNIDVCRKLIELKEKKNDKIYYK